MEINRRERDGRGKREKGGVTLEEPPSWRDGWRRACRARVGAPCRDGASGVGQGGHAKALGFFFPGNRKTLRDFK